MTNPTTRTLLEQALEALEYHTEQTRPIQKTEHAILEIRAEMAKPVEPSYAATQLAAMVLSDCGISTDHTALHERVAKRITRHEEQLIDSLQKLSKPVTDVVVTKNKSGQIVAVTLQDEDGRVMEVIDKSTPAPAWHDAPTCAGWWVRNSHEGIGVYSISEPSIKILKGSAARWYGTIPQDGGKS